MGARGEVAHTGEDREGIFLWFGDSRHLLLSACPLAPSGTRQQGRLYFVYN